MTKDVVEYIGQFVDLEFRNGEYYGLCPFHGERTPSFSVTPENGKWYCFGCRKGGDIIEFAKLYHKVNGYTAAEMLNVGIAKRTSKLPATKAIRAFVPHKKQEKEVKYSKLGNDFMSRYDFNLEKLQPWIDEGIPVDVLQEFQVRYDEVNNRIVIPIKDTLGNIINVCGRTLDPKWKEKGIPKYIYTHPLGRLDTLYGYSDNLTAIKDAGEVIVFEGAKSVMKAHNMGWKNTVAALTSTVNEWQTKILLSLGVRIVLAFDSDIDPRKDANCRKLARFANVWWVDSSDVLSPKDAPVDQGKDVWEKLYERRVRL